jgi:hypothetical protein
MKIRAMHGFDLMDYLCDNDMVEIEIDEETRIKAMKHKLEIVKPSKSIILIS